MKNENTPETMPSDFLYYYKAKVTNVVDGDTIDVDLDLGMKTIIKDLRIRLYGINAPEMKGRSKQDGIKSKNYLTNKINRKQIVIETIKDSTGKYGRLLGIVFLNKININDLMIAKGFAKEYK